MVHFRVPGVSVAFVNDGRIVWARGYGVNAAGSGRAVTTTTLFQAGSISKPISATAALALVDRGTLSLDEDVNVYLRSWRLPASRFSAHEKVTLRRVLSHTAGLTVPSFPGYEVGQALPTLIQVLDGRAPAKTEAVRVFETPGSRCNYSGGGIALEQLLLVDVTGRRFERLLDELVFVPMGMTASSFEQRHASHRAALVASAHDSEGRTLLGGHRIFPELAAAGLWTTPTDLLRWALGIANAASGHSRVLSQRVALEMLTPQKCALGLGPFVRGVGRDFNFSHRGWNPGFHSKVLFYPQRGQGAAVMTNGDGGGRPLVDEVLLGISKEFGWPNQPPLIEPVSLGRAEQERVTGTYRGRRPHAVELVATLRRRAGRVYLNAPLLGIESEIAFIRRDEFVARESGDRFRVLSAPDGSVSAIVFGDVTLTLVASAKRSRPRERSHRDNGR